MKAARMLDSSADPPGPIGLNIELLASPARSILVAAIAAIAAMGHSATPLRLRKTRRHPHMGLLESSIPIGAWVLFLSQGAAAVREAMRSVACRRDRRAQGLASGDLCSCSLHHLISGRAAMAHTHIPHACGEEATRMRPIYETACFLALGWHGHHPSRADRGRCRDADAFAKSLLLR